MWSSVSPRKRRKEASLFDLFNIFGPTREEVRSANEKQAAYSLALATILLEKGIMTNEEFNAAYDKAFQLLDQEWARMRDETTEAVREQEEGDNG